jgi:hypothetical protein
MFSQKTEMKTWRFNGKAEDKIIAFADGAIYKGNPQDAQVEHCLSDIRMGIVPTKKFFGIPIRYIKEIRMQESKNYLQVFFGHDSEEHLRIREEASRKDVFDYFREHIPSAQFSIEKYSKLKAGKKPLIAMAVVAALFLWTLYYAIGFDNGIEYETVSGRYNSVTGIVLAIASFGVIKTICFFGSWFVIALGSFLRKIRKPPVMHRLLLRSQPV